jgi:hypothetical protein
MLAMSSFAIRFAAPEEAVPPEHGPRLIRAQVTQHNHKAAPDDFEDPTATRSEADWDSLPVRTAKRPLVRRDR